MAASPKRRRAVREAATSAADLFCEVQGARIALTTVIEHVKAGADGAASRRTIRRALALYMRLRRANDAAERRLGGSDP